MFRDLIESVFHQIIPFTVVLVLCTWISALLGAVAAYVFQGPDEPRSVRGFFRFCFPVDLVRHKSCRTDYLNYAIHWVVDPFLIAPLMFSNILFALPVYAGLTYAFGDQPQLQAPVWLGIALLAIAVVLQDFMTFYVHYVMHRISALWELHKTHHSAEFLLPITNHRFHPIQTVTDHIAAVAPVGAFLGASAYVFALPIVDSWIIGRHAYFMLNILSFYHLRHSHVYLSYGWLERYLMSPAQHQLHHSRETQHWDKNFGLLFSCWDRWFGTIVYAKRGDQFQLGLQPHDQAEFNTVWQLFVTPLVNISRMAGRSVRRWRAGRGGVADVAAASAAAANSGAD